MKKSPIVKSYIPNRTYSHSDYQVVVQAISYHSSNNGAYWDSVVNRTADIMECHNDEAKLKIKSIIEDGLVEKSPNGYLKLEGELNA